MSEQDFLEFRFEDSEYVRTARVSRDVIQGLLISRMSMDRIIKATELVARTVTPENQEEANAGGSWAFITATRKVSA